MSHKPPLQRATKIPRTDANYRVTDGNIAAIDFGTTSVSLAYTTIGDKDVSTLVLEAESQSLRVSNAVLFKREGRSITVSAFGEIAKKRFQSMRAGEHSQHIYFERIKMLMRREKNIDRQSLVESFSGEKFYLVEVIAFILKYFKDLLIDHLSRGLKPFKTTDFDWVITVPAIWDARGKRMMREAAYLAALLTESIGITQFTSVSDGSLPHPIETNADKLSLALEPESAALYSQEMVGKEIEGARSTAAISCSCNYMVIDIGGGTVDITAHEEVPGGGINVVNVPTGNAWGGTKINEAFSKMLQEIVGDAEFKNFLAAGDHSVHMAALNKVLYTEFESQKVLFGQCKSDEMAINLSNKFVKFYDQALERGVKGRNGIEYEDDTLYINKQVVEAKLFGPAIDNIIECTVDAIRNNGGKIDTFYLVGGFGGCKYVHEKVKAAVGKLKGSRCNVFVPKSPQLAVATGAAMWRKEPEKIKARRVDATYGIGASTHFDPHKHDIHYRYIHEETKRYRCSSVFHVFIEKGEFASVDEVITTSQTPHTSSQTTVRITICRTPNLGVQYTKDKNGKLTVTKIGQLVIDIPNPDNIPRAERQIDITMDFSGTEIQAKAKYHLTGKEVKTVCDFLSTAT